ncbi:MAG: DDE-type integrase/transposase/recombinase [Sandaracinaceae bacterium]
MTPPLDPHLVTDAERRQQIALFRYGVIADLVQLPPMYRGLYKLLTDKASREYDIPFSLRRRVAAETMRGWLRDYRRGGFDALMPKVRSDVGGARHIPPAVVDLLCETKDATPSLSIPLLIKKVRDEHPGLVTGELPLSTVHRLLSRRGLMVRNKDDATSKDRRRFEFDAAGELWMSDVMYGPKIRERGRVRRTYLIAFLDDATRVIPHAAFTFSEGTVAFLPVLEQAVRKRGVPKRLYVDNGAAFRSRHLALVCAKLGIALIHARPYSPQGKGKMERWFRTARMQLMPTLDAVAPLTLEAMNRRLSAWVEGEYHHAPHRGLGKETPADRWARLSDDVKMPDADVGDCFLWEQKRKVARDRTVTLDGVAFEVDVALVGHTVALRFDPSRAPERRTVEVWHDGKRIEVARRLDALANCYVKRHSVSRVLEIDAKADDVPEGLAMRELAAEPDVGADDDELRRVF